MVSLKILKKLQELKNQSPKTEEERNYMNAVPYTSAIGSLMYVMVCTRPDIAHAMGVVSKYMSNPSKQHWEAVKWIMRRPEVAKIGKNKRLRFSFVFSSLFS
ncbi:hypothetical protein SADUNF_Sadunf07G0016500 [Salix dunnii]|uniref:Retrovirus-related Pol polyprotein from transposon TNT 1-94 n=1 Tax=Salix dunnii TaxID=1413687 RepID=A0A835MYM1_9ROSI|nr:hypothetical protein SADUNF_Sadunf07G0016500 [Salix dunnii]